MSISASSESRWRIDRAPSVVIDGGRISRRAPAVGRERILRGVQRLLLSVPRSASSSWTSPASVRWSNVGNTGQRSVGGPSAGGSFAAARSPGRVDLRRPTAVSSGRRPYSRRRARDPPSGRRAGAGRLISEEFPTRTAVYARTKPDPGHEPPSAPHSALAACLGVSFSGVSCTPRRRRGPVRRRSG